jgi:hypothetical protein
MKNKIAVIKVKLMDTKFPIWRRIEVPLDINLHQLHNIIQAAMGWTNSHLYGFYFTKQQLNAKLKDEYFDPKRDIDTKKTTLAAAMAMAKQCVYTYDYGDNWDHEVKFEKTADIVEGVKYPQCTKGKSECPFEDVGGVGGYENLIEVIKGPASEEKEEFKDWLGFNDEDCKDFDPLAFDLTEANGRLNELDKNFEPEY